jgi:hypothetical protein
MNTWGLYIGEGVCEDGLLCSWRAKSLRDGAASRDGLARTVRTGWRGESERVGVASRLGIVSAEPAAWSPV